MTRGMRGTDAESVMRTTTASSVCGRAMAAPAAVVLIAFAVAGGACVSDTRADIVAITAPGDHVFASIEWVGDGVSPVGYVGWFDPDAGNMPQSTDDLPLFSSSVPVRIGRAFVAGESLGLAAAFEPGGPIYTLHADDGATRLVAQADAEGWGFAVRAPSVQPDSTDTDFFEHALIIVRFTTIPTPGVPGLIACAGLLASRRRR